MQRTVDVNLGSLDVNFEGFFCKHTITASYTLTDGTSETLELMVNVQ
ncbi:MAG: hypothetical protein J5646_00435 [Bacteroidales bacterium]|nr:hypothetical protein [Bacteroidales bacterium]